MRKILFLMLCLLFLTHTAADDFGNFAGSSDYGGSSGGGWGGGYSSSGGGGWSSGGGDWGSSGSRSSGGYGGGSGGGVDIGGLVIGVLVTVAAAGIGVFFKYYLGDLFESDDTPRRTSPPPRRTVNPQPPGAVRTSIYDVKPISGYSALDPQFSQEAFKQRLSNIYIRLQQAWQAKDLEPVRPFLTDALFNQYDLQLSNYRYTNTTNVTEHVTVLGITITGWKQDAGNDIIIAVLRARIIDYDIDDATGKLIRGSRTAEKFMEYEYAMSRKSGMKTASGSAVRTVNCPNCGSAVDINQSAVCKYCGSTLQAAPEDWVISGIKGLSQRTVGN